MPTARSSGGHTVVAVLVALTALAHGALAVVPSARPGWVPVVSGLLAVLAVGLLVLGLTSGRARFGGDGEDGWLVAVAALGAAGVATGLVLAFVSFSAGGGKGVDLWSLAALLVDALTVRVAIFTLRRAARRVGP